MTKNQFFSVWIIFGLAVYYGIHQLLGLLIELVTCIEIRLDVNPHFLMYSQTLWYLLVIIVLAFLALRVINAKTTPMKEFNAYALRRWLVLISGTGLVSQIVNHFIQKHRLHILIPYLDKHNINVSDYYDKFLWLPSIPNVILFISATIIFFILTKKQTKSKC